MENGREAGEDTGTDNGRQPHSPSVPMEEDENDWSANLGGLPNLLNEGQGQLTEEPRGQPTLPPVQSAQPPVAQQPLQPPQTLQPLQPLQPPQTPQHLQPQQPPATAAAVSSPPATPGNVGQTGGATTLATGIRQRGPRTISRSIWRRRWMISWPP
jgi:hypothetical protein